MSAISYIQMGFLLILRSFVRLGFLMPVMSFTSFDMLPLLQDTGCMDLRLFAPGAVRLASIILRTFICYLSCFCTATKPCQTWKVMVRSQHGLYWITTFSKTPLPDGFDIIRICICNLGAVNIYHGTWKLWLDVAIKRAQPSGISYPHNVRRTFGVFSTNSATLVCRVVDVSGSFSWEIGLHYACH